MRRYVWRGATRNFGDELNDLIWPRLLPGLFTETVDDAALDDGSALFLGIGSVLDARHAPDRRKVVAGAGFGGYQAPVSLDRTWHIYWVRGPRTARQLGLPAAFGLGDPASLLPLVHAPGRLAAACPAAGGIGFMPHFESLAHGAWAAAATAADVTLIDPRGAPRDILARIAACRVLLSEALHGVIVADAIRVPWVALAPVAPIHRAKWFDWAASLGLAIQFHDLPASTLRECLGSRFTPHGRIARTGLAHAGALLDHLDCRSGRFDRAVAALRAAAGAVPQLSASGNLACAQARMLDRLQTLRGDHANLCGKGWQGHRRR
jgi:succinoglycan biosynthesis protein ExoV